VSSFRLDNYAVTVGRFRQFVAAWNGGWRPEEGAGKHSYLNGGQGLNNRHSSPAYEPGWAVVDNDSVVLTTKKLTSCSGSNLTDDYQLIPYACSTWTEEPDVNERLPIVCVNWLEAYAFCIWDGAFLPSDAELEYAAAGGSQQRKYPWGPADPGQANQYAIVECSYPTSSICMSASKIAPVGSASLGAGRWGQFDLVGNVRQLSFDGTTAYPTKCTDCAELYRDSKSMRGGSFASDASQLAPAYSFDMDTTERRYDTGFRCARSP
jgi:formylglycine-generating enzyme required for sulfatase activity